MAQIAGERRRWSLPRSATRTKCIYAVALTLLLTQATSAPTSGATSAATGVPTSVVSSWERPIRPFTDEQGSADRREGFCGSDDKEEEPSLSPFDQFQGWTCVNGDVLRRVSALCASRPWLRCLRYEDMGSKQAVGVNSDDWVCSEGAQGAVTLVELTAPHVFRNCVNRVDGSDLEAAQPCRDRVRTPVQALMKILKQPDEGGGRSAVAKLHRREVRRSRAAAALTNQAGAPFAPAFYDVFVAAPANERDELIPDAIIQNTFFEEVLSGANAQAVFRIVASGETSAIEEAWDDSTRLLLKTVAFEARLEEAVRAVLMQTRYRLSLLDGVFALQLELIAAGISHCDFHLGNLLLLKSAYTTPASIADGLIVGNVVFPPAGWREASSLLAQELQQRWVDQLGSFVGFPLHVSNWRIIDLGHAVAHDSIEEAGHAPQQLVRPCRKYRQRFDDIIEIGNSIDLALQRDSQTNPDLASVWLRFMETHRRLHPREVGLMESRYRKRLTAFKTFLNSQDSFLADLHSRLTTEPSMKTCTNPTSNCSISDSALALQIARKTLSEASSKLPVNTFLNAAAS